MFQSTARFARAGSTGECERLALHPQACAAAASSQLRFRFNNTQISTCRAFIKRNTLFFPLNQCRDASHRRGILEHKQIGLKSSSRSPGLIHAQAALGPGGEDRAGRFCRPPLNSSEAAIREGQLVNLISQESGFSHFSSHRYFLDSTDSAPLPTPSLLPLASPPAHLRLTQ